MSEADRSRWDSRYREEAAAPYEPSSFLTSLDALLPRAGRALDIAGGAGRNAVWLAQRGLAVTLVDVSPVGLSLAEARARRAGVRIDTRPLDLETDALPEGPFALVVQILYLERSLFAAIPTLLAPGGLFVVAHPTRSNLQRHEKPGAAYLLGDGELAGLVAGLEQVRYEEGWFEEGRYEARAVWRRPAHG